MMQIMRRELQDALASLKGKTIDSILDKRFERLLMYGKFRAND
jgi:acetyl-CoA carboxylase alpha subunit